MLNTYINYIDLDVVESAVYILRPLYDDENFDDKKIVDFLFDWANLAACEQLNLSRDILRETKLREFQVNDDLGFFERYVAVSETGQEFQQEYTIPPNYPYSGDWFHKVQRVYDSDFIIISNVRKHEKANITPSVMKSLFDMVVGVQALGEIAEFIRGVAHDIKTPLSTILTSAYLMKRSETEDRRDYHIEQIKTAAENITDLVNQMVSIAGLRAGTANDKLRNVDATDIISEVVSNVQLLADVSNIKINYNLMCRDQDGNLLNDGCRISVDPDMFERVLQNLLVNAINYTENGGSVDIKVTQVNHRRVMITIKDTGIGIPPQDLPNVFDRFYRGDKAREMASGTGLGLHISKQIIDLHGGKITANSEEGRGTEFIIVLPIAQDDEATKLLGIDKSKVNLFNDDTDIKEEAKNVIAKPILPINIDADLSEQKNNLIIKKNKSESEQQIIHKVDEEKVTINNEDKSDVESSDETEDE